MLLPSESDESNGRESDGTSARTREVSLLCALIGYLMCVCDGYNWGRVRDAPTALI